MIKKHEPFFHLAKRTSLGPLAAWSIRGWAFVFSVLFCAVVTVLITKKDLGFYFEHFFQGVFGTPRNTWVFFHDTAMLLLIALAVTPCFKMKFWNIGGEGQILMGALGCSVILFYMGGKFSDATTIIVSIIVSIAFGTVWAIIPAIFKAKWNTNETLLTLMMNYIAVCLVNYFIKSVATSGTGILTFTQGIFPKIAGNEFIFIILVAIATTAFMAAYLKISKEGYEIAVVGESINTAKYIGIKTGRVIVRTLGLCGIICGLVGFLLVSGTDHAINEHTVGGRGFIGVLISWLAHFNPITMVIASLLFVFIERGSMSVGNYGRLGESYPSVMTGIFFFFIIAVEFFVNFKVIFRENIQAKLDAIDNSIRSKLKMKEKPDTIILKDEKAELEKEEEPQGDYGDRYLEEQKKAEEEAKAEALKAEEVPEDTKAEEITQEPQVENTEKEDK